jgi:hypothetical protein
VLIAKVSWNLIIVMKRTVSWLFNYVRAIRFKEYALTFCPPPYIYLFSFLVIDPFTFFRWTSFQFWVNLCGILDSSNHEQRRCIWVQRKTHGASQRTSRVFGSEV